MEIHGFGTAVFNLIFDIPIKISKFIKYSSVYVNIHTMTI